MFRSCFYIVAAMFAGPVLFAAEVEVRAAAKSSPLRPGGSAVHYGAVSRDLTLPGYSRA